MAPERGMGIRSDGRTVEILASCWPGRLPIWQTFVVQDKQHALEIVDSLISWFDVEPTGHHSLEECPWEEEYGTPRRDEGIDGNTEVCSVPKCGRMNVADSHYCGAHAPHLVGSVKH